ncbi:MAG: regulatory protein GemA [Melioribacteraceae bacterium]
MEITKGQINKLHILKQQLKMTEEEYRTALESYGVNTSKQLSYEQAADLIRKLIKLLPKELRENFERRGKDKKQKYDELGIRWNEKLREHYATPKQLRMLEAMWMTSDRVQNKTEEALRKFIKRITGKERMEWLLISDIRKIIKAINSL